MSRKVKNCVGQQDATILGIKSPREFSVRLTIFQEPFSLLKDSLNTFYQQNADYLHVMPGTSLHINDTFAIFSSSRWCRAQVIGIHSNDVTLMLLDYGEKVEKVTVGDLYILDDHYVRENAYAFYCHLPGVLSTAGSVWNPAALDEMKRLVVEHGADVQIIPVGPIQQLQDAAGCSVKSLPVEVTWTFTEAETPFSPNITKTINLAEKLHRIHFAVTSNNQTHYDPFQPYNDLLDIPASATELLYEETELNDSEENDECYVKEGGASSKIKRDFRWLDPEIPGEVEFKARCTHVDNSGQIYLHLYENRTTMRIIRQVLQDKYRGTAGTTVDKMEVGQECIARYNEDKYWYRARVLEVSEKETNVVFVDYGNTNIVKNKYVRSKLFCKDNPIQAIRVVLGNVGPWSGTEKWSDDCLDFIHEKLLYTQPGGTRLVTVKVVGCSKDLPLQVTIQIPPKAYPEGAWVDLGDLLVNRGDALFVDGFNPSKELVSYWKKESKGIGFVAPGTYNNNNKKKFTQVKKHPERNSPKSSYIDLFPALNLTEISKGDIIDFQLTEIVSYNKIIVHPLVDTSTSQLSFLADQYLEMMVLLQEIADDMPPVISATDGLPVAARFHGDARGWFRGVIQQHSASKLLVQYVDYGPMTYWLDSDQVKELPQHCLSVPVAGVELILPVDSASHEEDDNVTKKMMEVLYNLDTCKKHDNLLTARITSVKPQLTGHIIHKSSGQPVYKHLKMDGIIT